MLGFKQAQFHNFGIRTDQFQILNRTATFIKLGQQINNFPNYFDAKMITTMTSSPVALVIGTMVKCESFVPTISCGLVPVPTTSG
jgi:hypothetical protein